jgi:hypothetical protein
MKELIEALKELIRLKGLYDKWNTGEVSWREPIDYQSVNSIAWEKAKQVVSKYENQPKQKTLEDMVYEAGQNINGEMFISPLDAIDIAKEYARNQSKEVKSICKTCGSEVPAGHKFCDNDECMC